MSSNIEDTGGLVIEPTSTVMADDIDDLLDEVESKFLAKAPAGPPYTSQNPPPVPKRKFSNPDTVKSRQAKIAAKQREKKEPEPEADSSINRGDSHELREAINDICGLPDTTEEIKRSGQANLLGHLSMPPPQKCFMVYLGGSSQYPGLSSSSAPRPCNNLRCTTCDFKVVMFNDLVWDKLTDHLFLRNNMPDYERLKQSLQRAKGWRAYACQCHCTSMNSLVEVRKHEILKWVCGSH